MLNQSTNPTAENTPESLSERPEAGMCMICKTKTFPWFRNPLLGLAGRWFRAPDKCSACADSEKKNTEEKRKISIETTRREKAFASANVSPKFRERTFQNFKLNEKNKLAFDAAFDFDPNQKNGIVLWGPTGSGKTHLAAAIVNSWVGKVPALFLSSPDMLAAIRPGSDKDPKALDLAKRVRLLVIDDLGAEKSSEWTLETHFAILNYRYDWHLPTIITTNYSLEMLERKVGQRVVSRLIEMCRFIEVSDKDHRIEMRPKR